MWTWKWPARWSIAVAGLTAALCGLTPAPAGAQSPARIRVGLFAAVIDARGGLPAAPLLDTPVNVLSYTRFEATPAVGLAVELDLDRWPVDVRISGERSVGGDEVGVWGCVPGIGCPSILIEVPTEISTSRVSADLVLGVPVGPAEIRPSLGIGWLRQAFRWDPSDVGSFSLAPGEHVDHAVALQGGLGASVPLGPVAVDAAYEVVRAREDVTRPAHFGVGRLGLSFGL